MASLNRIFKPKVVVALVPLVFACGLLLPEHAALHVGVGEALGCGGSPGGNGVAAPEGWTSLEPLLAPSPQLAAVPIATDGFFMIEGHGSLTNDAAIAGLEVAVNDEGGAPITGETKFLFNRGTFVFAWSARSPLEKGAKLKAVIKGTPAASSNVGGEFALEVVGDPTPLPTPSFTIGSWFDFFDGADDGPWLTCQASQPLRDCQMLNVQVPSTFEKRLGAEVTLQAPAITGGVYWKAEVELDAGIEAQGSPLVEYYGEPAVPSQSLGRYIFQTGKVPCATVVLTDLRTDRQTRTQTCVSARPGEYADTDTQLGKCAASPSQSLTEIWCRLKPGSSSIPECIASAPGGGGSGGAGSAGYGGYPGSGGLVSDYFPDGIWGGSSASPPSSSSGSGSGGSKSATNAASEEGSSGPRTSKGCQLGGGFSSSGGAAAGLALTLALFARRRSLLGGTR